MAEWMKPRGPEYATDEPEFMVSYGRAMAEWGNVEHELARIYCKLLKPKDIRHATMSFFSVINARDRMGMVDTLVACAFGEPDEMPPHDIAVAWNKVSNALRRASKRRNRLAHLHVWHGSKIGTFGHGHLYELAALPKSIAERKKEVVSIRTLVDYSKSFCVVWKRLKAFYDLLP